MWSRRDSNEYIPRSYDPLQQLYQDNNLPLENPEARAEFIAESVLHLSMTDHGVVMRKANEKGKAAALNLLEDMVISSHKERIEKHKQEIILPLV